MVYDILWYDMVLYYGMENGVASWYGISLAVIWCNCRAIWYGMVWYGMVWYGMVHHDI